jgi:mono/diheme cytochrome c family protein
MKTMIALMIPLCLSPAMGMAQDAAAGAALYDLHCSVCHGLDARGDGPLAPALLLQPPNLRTLAARHDGRFPVARVVARIDGRDPLVSHGSPMPVYGEFFEGDDTALKAETGQPIMTSRPVVDLVTYLEGVQE